MKDLLADFGRTIDAAAAQLHALTEAEARRAREAGAWTPKEIVGHLIDSAANNHARFVRAQYTDDLVFPGYEQEEWVRAQRYNEESWPLLIELWKHYNLHLLHVMASAPEETLRQPRTRHTLDKIAWQTIDARQPTTLEYLMRDYVGHLKSHLRQIFPNDGENA
ncbi:MAG TPA: DinB family protein [Pyrinomonadaceae bacterium]|nr:DinB family protein [Pyrinomonadaceae bacterium]